MKNDELFINIISFRILTHVNIAFFIVFFSNIVYRTKFSLVLIALVLLSWTNEITLVFIEKKS